MLIEEEISSHNFSWWFRERISSYALYLIWDDYEPMTEIAYARLVTVNRLVCAPFETMHYRYLCIVTVWYPQYSGNVVLTPNGYSRLMIHILDIRMSTFYRKHILVTELHICKCSISVTDKPAFMDIADPTRHKSIIESIWDRHKCREKA